MRVAEEEEEEEEEEKEGLFKANARRRKVYSWWNGKV